MVKQHIQHSSHHRPLVAATCSAVGRPQRPFLGERLPRLLLLRLRLLLALLLLGQPRRQDQLAAVGAGGGGGQPGVDALAVEAVATGGQVPGWVGGWGGGGEEAGWQAQAVHCNINCQSQGSHI